MHTCIQASITPATVHAAVVFASWVPEAREELALASRWLAERLWGPAFADVPFAGRSVSG